MQSSKENVLGADVLVLHSRGLFARHLQHLADTIGKVVAAHRVRWLGSVTTNASCSGRISIPLKSAIVASTPDRSPGRCVVVSPITRAPAARAATIPAEAFRAQEVAVGRRLTVLHLFGHDQHLGHRQSGGSEAPAGELKSARRDNGPAIGREHRQELGRTWNGE